MSKRDGLEARLNSASQPLVDNSHSLEETALPHHFRLWQSAFDSLLIPWPLEPPTLKNLYLFWHRQSYSKMHGRRAKASLLEDAPPDALAARDTSDDDAGRVMR